MSVSVDIERGTGTVYSVTSDVWNSTRSWTGVERVGSSSARAAEPVRQLTASGSCHERPARRLSSFRVADILGLPCRDSPSPHHQQQRDDVSDDVSEEAASTRSNDDSVLSSTGGGPSPTGSDRDRCWAETDPRHSTCRELEFYIDACTVNAFQARLDKFWQYQLVKFDFTADLTGTGKRSEEVIK